MSVKKTYQYKLNLNKEVKAIIDKNLELCCWFYNYLLEKFRQRDQKGEKQPTKRELQNSLPEIKEQQPQIKQVHSHTLQDVAKRVYGTWQRYRELKRLEDKKKYPNYKPYWRYNSFVYHVPMKRSDCGYKLDNSPLAKKTENRKIRLSLGMIDRKRKQFTTNLKLSRNLQGDIKTLTIKRKNNRYYALFSCENVPLRPLPKTVKKEAFDLGLKHLLIDTRGNKVKNPRFYKKEEDGIKATQRILSGK